MGCDTQHWCLGLENREISLRTLFKIAEAERQESKGVSEEQVEGQLRDSSTWMSNHHLRWDAKCIDLSFLLCHDHQAVITEENIESLNMFAHNINGTLKEHSDHTLPSSGMQASTQSYSLLCFDRERDLYHIQLSGV